MNRENWGAKGKMKKILIWAVVCSLFLAGCQKKQEYDAQLIEFMTKLVSYSTYEEAGLSNIKKYNSVFKEYFTEEGYQDFIEGLYPSIYVEFTTKNKVNRTEDIRIKKVKEEVTGDSVNLQYEIKYTLRGGKKTIKHTDNAIITLVQEDGVYKIKKFALLNSSDIIYEMFFRVIIQ